MDCFTTILTPFYLISSNRMNGLVLENLAKNRMSMLWNPEPDKELIIVFILGGNTQILSVFARIP